jgi:hypothetical protein
MKIFGLGHNICTRNAIHYEQFIPKIYCNVSRIKISLKSSHCQGHPIERFNIRKNGYIVGNSHE